MKFIITNKPERYIAPTLDVWVGWAYGEKTDHDIMLCLVVATTAEAAAEEVQDCLDDLSIRGAELAIGNEFPMVKYVASMAGGLGGDMNLSWTRAEVIQHALRGHLPAKLTACVVATWDLETLQTSWHLI